MSPSETDFAALAEAVMREGDGRLAAGETAGISDASVQQLLTTATRLYARKTDVEARSFSPLADGSILTATDVAVTVTALLRAADLNLFDLAMWAGRAQPVGEGSDGNG
jgi:sulfur transfer complex TusBCD TusB component (DsrH family)